MSTHPDKPGRTGIFYVKNPNGIVVLRQGKEIARYATVDDFVAIHEEGLRAIEQRDEQLHQSIAAQYDPLATDR